jgi:tetratricopeptide (TPR) repeat protein
LATLRLARIAGIGVLLAATAGCQTSRLQPRRALKSPPELTAVPFFPQRQYQCGPAALATVLVAADVSITPDELVPEVYLPTRHGSLQAELIAAARRHERVPYLLAPSTETVVDELAAGRPVLVLQNFGSRRAPIWHFAVVIGYDAAHGQFILRSGTVARSVVSATRFEATWRRADSWALVTLRASELPADPDSQRYLDAVSGLEAAGRTTTAVQAYRAALLRWPDDPRAWLGIGNIAWAEGRWSDAEAAFRELLRKQPDNIAARNNLALALHRQGCTTLAEAELMRAVAAAEAGPLAHEVADSLAEIRAATSSPDDAVSVCVNH